MKNLKTQVTNEIDYAKSNTGKALGTAAGIATGVIYGMSAKHGNWVVGGIAVAGGLLGAILGAMADNAIDSNNATSNAIGSINDRRRGMLSKVANVNNVNNAVETYGVCPSRNFAGITSSPVHYVESDSVDGAQEATAFARDGANEFSFAGEENTIIRSAKRSDLTPVNNISRVNTLVQPFNQANAVGSKSRQNNSRATDYNSSRASGNGNTLVLINGKRRAMAGDDKGKRTRLWK